LWYIDKTFTIASTQDQFIATVYPIISPAITTCKGSRGGCSDEAIEEIKAVHEARQQQPFITKPQPMTPQLLTPQVPLRFLSVCSGMEAASVAWEPLGWKAVGFSEIEPFPCAVLSRKYPNIPNYGSLTEYQSWPLQPGSIDLLVGGTPCQSFSVAGLRKGLADPRGNLALVFLGLADKLKPRWIVWENVPGVLSSDGGRDFGSFLGALEQLGYGWAYRVLDAQYFGVPQRRRRVFVVASLGGRDVAASVLLKPESVCWHPAPRRKKGQATAADAKGGVGTDGILPTSATVTAKWAKGADADMACDGSAANIIPQYWNGQDVVNTLTRKGMDQLMPDKDNFQGVVVPNVIGTLDTECGGGKLSHQSIVSGHVIPTQPPTPCHDNDTVGTLCARDFKGVGNQYVQEGKCVPMMFKIRGGSPVETGPQSLAVRRLTPVECERLQGFPDNWSQIPWKGKPADQCPDGPRYKCAGNSMAVPVMRWIGDQIARVELSLNNPTK